MSSSALPRLLMPKFRTLEDDVIRGQSRAVVVSSAIWNIKMADTYLSILACQSEEHDSEHREQLENNRENNSMVKMPSSPDLGASMMDDDCRRLAAVRGDQQFSSEEELEVINKVHSEKRRWSQVNRCVSAAADSSASSDDEVRELTRRSSSVSLPIEFRTSPPADAHRPDQSRHSPPAKLYHYATETTPKRRHRHSRPYLDFEKMQQYCTVSTELRKSRDDCLFYPRRILVYRMMFYYIAVTGCHAKYE
uniref:Uncharacterized protein n=1 Tax=Strigamia maritima TaxID=126957 RepID=T1JC24_STRMM